MNRDPKAHLKRVAEIVQYFKDNYSSSGYNEEFGETYLDYSEETRYWLNNVGIKQSENFQTKDLINANQESVANLHGYIFGGDENLTKFFESKHAVVALEGNEKFESLNLYLKECFECIRAKRHIATAILLRACVEILVKMQGCEEPRSLPKGIAKLMAKFNEGGDFELFREKQTEIKTFFDEIKKIGDDAAHLKKSMKEFVETNNNEEMFKLFCLLTEDSILKDEIAQKTKEERKRRWNIDLTKKEKQIEKAETEISDDDIPF